MNGCMYWLYLTENNFLTWKKNYASFEKFNFVVVQKEAKFRNLQTSKVLNDDTDRIFLVPFKIM